MKAQGKAAQFKFTISPKVDEMKNEVIPKNTDKCRATERGGQQGQLPRGPTFSWGPKHFDHYYIDELTQL